MFKKKKEALEFFEKAYNLDNDNVLFSINNALSLYENRSDDNSVWKLLEISKKNFNDNKDNYDENEQDYIDKSVQYLQRMKDKEDLNVGEKKDEKKDEKEKNEEKLTVVKKPDIKKDDDDEEEEDEDDD